MLHKRLPRFDSLPHYFLFLRVQNWCVIKYFITQHSPSMACAGEKALTFSVILVATILTVSSVIAK